MTTGRPIRVLVVDDHPVVREGLKALLAHQPGIVVMGEVGTAEGVVGICADLRPDVVLLDLRLPGIRCRELVTAILQLKDAPSIVVISAFGSHGEVAECLNAGALGYVLKSAGGAEIVAAIRAAFNGSRYLSREAALQLAEATCIERLSSRELEVLELMADGCTNLEIARRLRISRGTAKAHVHAILGKLGVKSRTAAVALALRRGLVRR
ncbi:MAG: response regulator transcription factor [Acidobacteria bacterium]|nr:response regulator transcription factor [Acidobacteriota bacterium]